MYSAIPPQRSPNAFGSENIPIEHPSKSCLDENFTARDQLCSALDQYRPDESQALLTGDQVISPARAIFFSISLSFAKPSNPRLSSASYTLAPLKSRLSRELGTSNTEFSVFATGIVFLGQALLLVGETQQSVRLMALGLFIYGLSLSPLAVVQESIIMRFFHSHGLGMSMAMGLVAGKFASFLSAPLTGLSFIINLVYMFVSHRLIMDSGETLEAFEAQHGAQRRAVYSIPEAIVLKRVAKKRSVKLKEAPLLGDVFWVYIGLNVLCRAIWSPFTHLAANLLEKRYNLSEATASMQASYLLAGSIILYPASGYLVDRVNTPRATIRMFSLSSLLTMFCYAWLAAPPQWTRSPLPGIISFAGGVGFSPFLLVVIVPTIVPLKYVSTTLGVYKAMEHTGSTIFQTLAGIWLDNDIPGYESKLPKRDDTVAIQHLLYAFLFFNFLQLISLEGLIHLDKRRKERGQQPYCPEDLLLAPGSDSNASVHSISDNSHTAPPVERTALLSRSDNNSISCNPTHNVRRCSEKRRGHLYAWLSASLFCVAWGLFLSTAWLRLHSKEERAYGGHNTFSSVH